MPSSHELNLLQQDLKRLSDGVKQRIGSIQTNFEIVSSWIEVNQQLSAERKIKIKNEPGVGPTVKLEEEEDELNSESYSGMNLFFELY